MWSLCHNELTFYGLVRVCQWAGSWLDAHRLRCLFGRKRFVECSWHTEGSMPQRAGSSPSDHDLLIVWHVSPSLKPVLTYNKTHWNHIKAPCVAGSKYASNWDLWQCYHAGSGAFNVEYRSKTYLKHKSRLPITYFAISQSLWNIAQSTAVILPCFAKNFTTIGQLKLMLCTN